METKTPDGIGESGFAQSKLELAAIDCTTKFSHEAFAAAHFSEPVKDNQSDKTKSESSENALKKAPESMEQRIKRTLGSEICDHLSNKDKDWDWLIAHQDQLAKGLMAGAEEGNFHAFMTEVNKKCPHILFENNPRPASRPVGEHLDYSETATADWLVKMERGFLRSNDRLMNYVQWSDYTTNIRR